MGYVRFSRMGKNSRNLNRVCKNTPKHPFQLFKAAVLAYSKLEDKFRIFNTDSFQNRWTMFSEFAVAEFWWPFVWCLRDQVNF